MAVSLYVAGMEFAVVRLAFDRSCAEERFSLFLFACVVAALWVASWLVKGITAGVWVIFLTIRVVAPWAWRWRVAMLFAGVPVWVGLRVVSGL